jgi:hypothetical protein
MVVDVVQVSKIVQQERVVQPRRRCPKPRKTVPLAVAGAALGRRPGTPAQVADAVRPRPCWGAPMGVEVVQVQVPMVQQVQTTLEFPVIQYVDSLVDVPVVAEVPQIQKVQKTVDVPAKKQVQVPMVQQVETTLEFPVIPYVDRLADTCRLWLAHRDDDVRKAALAVMVQLAEEGTLWHEVSARLSAM